MGNQFSLWKSAANRKKTWDLTVKERGVQKLCEKCQRDCKVLRSSGGPKIKSKFICFTFKGKKERKSWTK